MCNVLEWFGARLKTDLGLVMPNQYCQAIMKESEAGFWIIFVA